MGSIYVNGTTPGYPSIADVILEAGLPLQTWDGWEWNTRSSGGLNQLLGVIVHHTASPPTTPFYNDWSYCAQGHPDSPVANLLLGRGGEIGLHSGGAANHAGKGGPWHASKGIVPLDAGNSNLLGIEASNSGVGEPWGDTQLEHYERLCAALCEAYDLVPESDLPAHFAWAPTRKIDPWGPGDFARFPYTRLDEWIMQGPGSFTAAVAARMGGAPPPGEDDDMKPYLVQTPGDGKVFVCDGAYQTYVHISDPGSLERLRADMRAKGVDDKINVIDPAQLQDQGVELKR